MRKITKHFILGSETKTDASKVVILPPTKQDLIGAQPASQTLQTPTGDQQIQRTGRLLQDSQKNPIDRNGLPTKCAICDSFNHWQKQCPDKDKVEHKTYTADEIVLHQNDYDSPDELKFLMAESWSSALLDCGASKTVCGKI